jgi:glycerol-3-phosphate dehydrogenase (NAD(P)+)
LQWVRSEETTRDINDNHRNSRYLGNDIELSNTLRATTDFSEAANCADVVVMGVPSHGLRGVLTELAKELRRWVSVVSLVKGLEQGTNYRMSQIVDEVLPGHPAGMLAGPNIAREVAEALAAAAVLAMPDQHLAANLANLFRTRRFRTYTTDDVVGVEMAGALKNVYAIAVGMGYSLGIGENTRAMVMSRAVREMSKLGEAAGGHRDTFAGLAGMGDLIVTCTSQRSRNRHVGEQLGAGKPIDEIIASMDQVAEGVKASSVIRNLPRSTGYPCRSLARSTALSTTARLSTTRTAASRQRSPAARSTARVSSVPVGRQAATFLGMTPIGRAICALSGEDSRRRVG